MKHCVSTYGSHYNEVFLNLREFAKYLWMDKFDPCPYLVLVGIISNRLDYVQISSESIRNLQQQQQQKYGANNQIYIETNSHQNENVVRENVVMRVKENW